MRLGGALAGLLATATAIHAAPDCAGTTDAAAERPELQRVSAAIWRIAAARGDPDRANHGLTAQLVVVRDGVRVWLVGSGPTPAFGAALDCAIRTATGQAVTDVINTRAAPELSMGNAAFAGARFWALADVIVAMQRRCGACLERLRSQLGDAGASLQRERIRVPDRAPARAAATRGRLGPFVWHALERAPGERVLVLSHRRDAVVIAQGLLWAGDLPDLRDTRSDRLLASLRELRRVGAGATLLGEQGDPADEGELDVQIGYLEALRAAVAERLARGDDAASAQIEFAAYADLPSYRSRQPLNVQHIWRELEPTIFR